MAANHKSVVSDFGTLPTSFDDPRSLADVLTVIARRFGFAYFSMSLLPKDQERRFKWDNYVNNLPPDIVEYWVSKDLTNRNPYINSTRQVVLPIAIEVRERPDDYLQSDIVIPTELYLKHDIHRIMIFPVQHRSRKQGWFTFFGNQPPLTEEKSIQLSVLCLYIFNLIRDLNNQSNDSNQSLTKRQLECLRLSAAGKTTSEIANITGIAEDTVNYHFVKAMKALNCVTRIQAVAKAIELDLI